MQAEITDKESEIGSLNVCGMSCWLHFHPLLPLPTQNPLSPSAVGTEAGKAIPTIF